MGQPFFVLKMDHEPFRKAFTSPEAEQIYWTLEDWNTLRAWWSMPDDVMPAKLAIPKLNDYLVYLEDRLHVIMKRHSPAYWLLLGRADRAFQNGRVRMELIRSNPQRITVALLATGVQGLYEAAARRFGSHDIVDLRDATQEEYPSPIGPTSPVEGADIKDVRRAFELCLAFDAANECLRHASRGAPVVLHSQFPFVVLRMDGDYAKLQKIHEARGLALSTAGSWFGIPMHFVHTNAFPGKGLVIFEFAPINKAWQNLGGIPKRVSEKLGLPQYTDGVGPTAFVRTQLDLQPLWSEMSKYPSAFQKAFGVLPDVFFAVWVTLHRLSLTYFHNEAARTSYGAQAYGYVVLPRSANLCSTLVPLVNEVFDDMGVIQRLKGKKGEDLVRQSMLALSNGHGEIDLKDLSRSCPLMLGHSTTLLDVTEGRNTYQHILDVVNVSKGREGHDKGDSFEQYARARVQAMAPKVIPWERGLTEIAFPDGHKGEFDICVVRGDCIILGECKAHSVSMKYLRGDRRAFQERNDELKYALKQIEDTAWHLALNPSGTNYELPPNVQYLVTVVCTALPEWLGTTDSECWLDPKTPRFCTPEELGRILHYNGGKFFSRLPYAHKLVRSL